MTQLTQTNKAFSFDHDEVDEEYPPAVMIREVVLTRYDKAHQKVRTAEAKCDAMRALPNLTPRQRQQLGVYERDLVKAQAAFSKEMARGMTDEGRKQDRLDAYRKTPEGREIYNTSRRKNRATANADLSGMTTEEKAAHKREQNAISARLYRQRAKDAVAQPLLADAQPDAYTNEELTLALCDVLQAAVAIAAPAPIPEINADFATHEATIESMTNLARKSGLAGPLELSEPFLSKYLSAMAALGRPI
ncbi:hypothetical protein [Cypionkella sp.]|uniref:hypothetical protein n=1 Tax=Cypionkella sp. TaxID=2811411 RepID=UPI0026237B6E|nr:hypothetical protein [Cypionkella sp.]